MYEIKSYTKGKANQLGVVVKPSTRKGKKIDVYKNGRKVASIGALGMNDYPTYLAKEKSGKVTPGTAKRRQAAYKKRHAKDRTKVGSPGFYADRLLW